MSRKKPTGQQKRSVQKKWTGRDWKSCSRMRSGSMWVAIRPDRDPEPVRRFGCFTADSREMGRWLVEKGVHPVTA